GAVPAGGVVCRSHPQPTKFKLAINRKTAAACKDNYVNRERDMSIRKRKMLTTLPRSDRPCVATLEMILSLPTSMIKTPAEGFEAVDADYDLSCDRILCDGAIAVIE